ncbi:hypothetical protein QA635_32720 [Bradyrhizobium brasilense]|nr:hypothetical protein [Bradyrhizobium australafricanum]WFU31287.1 hypothetical protein QA635_32720 [Bradyrhizobium australafricanum]
MPRIWLAVRLRQGPPLQRSYIAQQPTPESARRPRRLIISLLRSRHHSLKAGHGFDERRKRCAYSCEVLVDFSRIKIKPVPMPGDVTEALARQGRTFAVDCG